LTKPVAEYTDEENGGKKEVKGQLNFAEVEKKLTLNVTNTNTLIAMYGGENIDTVWVGKVITLYVDHNVRYGTKIVSGLRIRPEAPKVSRDDLLKRYNKLFVEAGEVGVEDMDTFVLNADATDAAIIELGKQLRDKVAAAKAF
jgi:hypothetical protein